MAQRIPFIIGHRGCKYPGIRGNSCEAVRRAIEERADIIEIDVALSRDGHFVSFHYPNLNPFIPSPSRKDLRELHDLDTVWSVLATIAGRTPVYLDIKEDLTELQVRSFVGSVTSIHKNDVIVGSFSGRVLTRFGAIAPRWTINYHCLPTMGAITRAVAVGAHWINPLPYAIRESFVRRAQSVGLSFVPAGNECDRKQLAYVCLGAYALSTFRPERLRRLLECKLLGEVEG